MSCKDLKQKRNLTVLYSVHVDCNEGTDHASVTVGLTDVFLMDGVLGYVLGSIHCSCSHFRAFVVLFVCLSRSIKNSTCQVWCFLLYFNLLFLNKQAPNC